MFIDVDPAIAAYIVFVFYHFDEGAGDVLTDSSGHGYHAKIIGAKWVPGFARRANAEAPAKE